MAEFESDFKGYPLNIEPQDLEQLKQLTAKADVLKRMASRAANDPELDHLLGIYAVARHRAEKQYWKDHPDELKAKQEREEKERQEQLFREWSAGEWHL